jgi:hypothetical protein
MLLNSYWSYECCLVHTGAMYECLLNSYCSYECCLVHTGAMNVVEFILEL